MALFIINDTCAGNGNPGGRRQERAKEKAQDKSRFITLHN
ncbi:hypothetical protein UUU_19160 [Klebsiella pneumoniae subsp. pneumoniae DSM 30104 = JCM 1662 = NBRC 14940]|nr:hypothetical protein UUU_19160 [Klebsiella pneumoniae subsp. pneumoniae DSM 30104 = JCM 1662 = NBRC 14940]